MHYPPWLRLQGAGVLPNFSFYSFPILLYWKAVAIIHRGCLKMKRSGFTLIELLVVVAIIAILAAIAIPNLLEAQTRAKVSRAKADLKTIVNGLEIYRVDNNQYPTYHYSTFAGPTALEFHIGGSVTGFATSPPFDGRNPITTPIGYVTSMPQDPFVMHKNGPPQLREYLYVNWDYALKFATDTPARVQSFMLARNIYGPYRLHSRGPDRFGPNSGIPYDPTNGTVSQGDITYGPKSGFGHYHPIGSGGA